ncbi:MAG: hypothetical protein ACOCVF_02155 [bacterium]
MVITDKFAYIRMRKCGSESLRAYFEKEFNVKNKVTRKGGSHPSIREFNKELKNKLIVSSIRNPWDWYVSIFKWHQKWRDKDNNPRFNCFIKNDNFEDYLDKLLINQNKCKSTTYINFDTMKKLDIGLFTLVYLELLGDKEFNQYNKKNFTGLPNIDYFIKLEDINDGIKNLFKEINYTNYNIDNLPNLNKTNHKPYKEMYINDDMIKLVEYKERFIIEKFNYQF